MRYLFVGLGGAVGSLLRYFIYHIMLKVGGGVFPPLGTLLVNLLGATALGWFTSKLLLSKKLPDPLGAAIGTGLIGSFTTFSTLSNELIILLQDKQYFLVVGYLLMSMIGGLICAYTGFLLGQWKRKAEVRGV